MPSTKYVMYHVLYITLCLCHNIFVTLKSNGELKAGESDSDVTWWRKNEKKGQH